MAETPAAGNGSAPPQPVQKARDPYTDGSGGWPVPIFDIGDTFKDIGSRGLRQYGGWVREEFLPQLVGRQAARVFREMSDNSSTVGAMLFSILQSMRKIEWRTQSPLDTPAAKEMEDFAESLRGDMTHTWEDFVIEALSMIVYGFAPHEIVYKRRLGKDPPGHNENGPGRGTPSSDFDDGRIGLRRLPLRGQDTILKWFFDPNGDILGLTQQPWVGALIDLPIEKLLLFRPTQHKNNPEGRSVLRNSYRSWYFVKRMEEQEAILFERMSGFPVMYVPNALLEKVNAKNPDPAAVQAYEAFKRFVTNVRIDEQMGAILPSDPYPSATGPSSVRMYEFQLVVPQFGRSAGTGSNTIIERHKRDILMTTLADFIDLGHTARGTQNLAISKVDMFFTAIEGWLNSIAAILNRHLLPRVWRMNNLPMDLMPQWVPDLAQRIDLDILSNLVLRFSQAGMPLFPDPDLENYLRDAAGFPDISDEAAWQATQSGTNKEALKKILERSIANRQKKLNGSGPKFPLASAGLPRRRARSFIRS